MNFYIFNSNRSKIVLSFFIFGMLCILYSIFLRFYSDIKTNKHFWLQNKESKSKHFKENNFKKLDYIFIGSSRTMYHISTNIFKDNNLSIYNFGLPFLNIYDYPFFVNQAIESKPKRIILSIPINYLFQEVLSVNPKLDDLKDIIKTQNFDISYKSINYYLNNINPISRDSINIRLEIIKLYKKEKESKFLLNESDCEAISSTNTSVNCSNGDSILYKNSISKNINRTLVLNKLNKNPLNLLNHLIDKIEKRNIIPIIIFETKFNNQYIYKIEEIKNLLNTKNIIDLTNYKIRDDFWADNEHLNNKGRIQYSEYLSRYLNLAH